MEYLTWFSPGLAQGREQPQRLFIEGTGLYLQSLYLATSFPSL